MKFKMQKKINEDEIVFRGQLVAYVATVSHLHLSPMEIQLFSIIAFIYDSKNVTPDSHNIKKALKNKNPQSRNDISSLM
jgi:hypothetical protein